MNRAPESVVRSVMDALDCEPDANRQFCVTCSNPTGDWDEDAGCATARKAADAAWAASLRAAAERLDLALAYEPDHGVELAGAEAAAEAWLVSEAMRAEENEAP